MRFFTVLRHLPNPRQLVGLDSHRVANVPEDITHDSPLERGELREVPLWKANKERWPPEVRKIAMEEQDCLGIDRRGNLYWDGKPIEVRYFGLTLTRWQQVGAAIVVVSALIGAIGVAGWVAYDDWACRAGLPSVACAQPE
jgi:hypothetical protein